MNQSRRVIVACLFIAVAAASGCNWLFRSDSAGTTDAAGSADAGSTDAEPPCLRIDDIDCDGVLNAVDNCRLRKNPMQLDEDGDTVGDVCDNCVGVPNQAQVNTLDNDDLGDACDGDPNMQQVTAQFFVEGGKTFLGASVDDWVATAADLRYSRLTDASADFTSRQDLPLLQTPATIRIEVGFKDLGNDFDFGIFVANAAVSPPATIDCMNARNNTDSRESARVFINTARDPLATSPLVALPAGPRRITLFLKQVTVSTVEVRCSVDGFTDVTFSQTFDMRELQVGVVGRGRAGTATYVVVAN